MLILEGASPPYAISRLVSTVKRRKLVWTIVSCTESEKDSVCLRPSREKNVLSPENRVSHIRMTRGSRHSFASHDFAHPIKNDLTEYL